MKLKADGRVLILDQPTTILTASVAAAATTLTVANNGGFVDDDFLLIGTIGEEKTEIARINAAVVAGTSLTTTALVFAHDEDTSITKIDYDQVRFYRGTTNVAAASTALAASQAIDPTETYSYYQDSTNTTGYGFVRFYNATGASYSVYSDAIPYTGYTNKMLRKIRNKVRKLIGEDDEQNTNHSNEDINIEINSAQKEIAHDRLWSFYEKTKSFSSVANQWEYSLATNVFVPYDAMYDTQPLAIVPLARMNILRWDNDTTGDPTHICIWNKKARVAPYPASGADATAIDDATDITAADTTITADDTSDFKSQGRIIIDDEVISYTGTTATTFTGCTRGEEGTTAAIHLDDAVITERDFVYHFQEDPDDLSNETDETAISDPSVIAYKAAAELSLENAGLHDRLIAKYQIALSQLRKVDSPKIKGEFGAVRDFESTISDLNQWQNPNRSPRDLE